MFDESTQRALPDELAQRVITIIADTQQIPREKISLESSFEELGLDSLDGVSIVFELENEFNVAIPNEEALMIRNVRDAVEALHKLVADESTAEAEANLQS